MASSVATLPRVQVKPKIKAADFNQFVAQSTELRRSLDAFQNVAARLGFGTNNLLEGTAYPNTRFTRRYAEIIALYRSNWIVRKVIDSMADDMLKNWIKLTGEIDPEQIDEFDKSVENTGTKGQLLQTLQWARLFGGAGAVIKLKGDQRRLNTPLNVEEVLPDTYRGLVPFDRWSGITPSAKICDDMDRPLDYGLPESYTVTTGQGQSFEIHASRVLRFVGRPLPNWERQAEVYWGISEVEVFIDELKKRDNTSWNIASLIFRANVFAMQMPDLASMLSGLGGNAQAQQRFVQTLEAINSLMSNQGMIILPKDGTLSSHQYGFAGIAEMYEKFMLDICGATEYPMSRLFGRSASGLSGTNEGDEHSYYELIGQKQKREVDPQLRKVLPVIAMSTWGEVPKDFKWTFAPVRNMSNEEQSELGAKKTTAVVEVFNAGLVSQQTALKELQQQSEETGLWTNVTNEDIEQADAEVVSPLEMESAGGFEGEPKEAKGDEGKPKKAQDAVLVKFPHDLVGFESPAKGARHCSQCRYYTGSDCRIVDDPVRGGDWCREFSLNPLAKIMGTDHALENHVLFQGLLVDIENDVGSTRSGPGWSVEMSYPYGYIQSTEGADGDEVDCFVGPNPDAKNAFVIRAKNPETGLYDEDKVMLGWDTPREAKYAFLENYSDPRFFESMETIPMKQLPLKLEQYRGRKLARDSRSGY